MLTLSSFNATLYDNIKGMYGVNNPQDYIFLQSFDGYTPLLLKTKQLLSDCDIAAICTSNEIPRYYTYTLLNKTISFVRKFYSLFLKTEFKTLRVTFENETYIIGNGLFLKNNELISLAVVPDDLCCIPTILVSRGKTTEILKDVVRNYSYQPPFKVVNQEYLDSFKYTMPDLSPIDVCKVLKKVENAKNN